MPPSLIAFITVLSVALHLGPTAYAQDPAKPQGSEITKIDQVLADVPRELLLAARSGAKKEAAASEATDILRTKVEGRTATLKFKVDRVEKYQRKMEKVDRYRIKAEDDRLREGVTTFRVFLWTHLDEAENAKAAALKKGREISVTGKVTQASITSRNNPELHIDLSDAKIN